jgi:hypothetical protein
MNSENVRKPNISLPRLLFSPFTCIAGGCALLTGVIMITASGVVCYFGNCHFDGLLDAHFGSIKKSIFLIYLAEGFINWLVLSVLITLSARLIAGSRYRMIDVFGTLALARSPYLIIALISLIPGVGRYAQYAGLKIMNIQTSFTPAPLDIYLFYAAIIILIIMIMWTVVLMYRAVAISCNTSGKKAVIYFAILLFVGEVISKLAIIATAGLFPAQGGAFKGLA